MGVVASGARPGADGFICTAASRESSEHGDGWGPKLGARVEPAEPAQALALKGKRRRAKTDRLDARWLAMLLAKEMLPVSWLPPEEIQRLRDLTRLRQALRHDRTRWAQRLHAILVHEGWPCSRSQLLTTKGRRWRGLRSDPPSSREPGVPPSRACRRPTPALPAPVIAGSLPGHGDGFKSHPVRQEPPSGRRCRGSGRRPGRTARRTSRAPAAAAPSGSRRSSAACS